MQKTNLLNATVIVAALGYFVDIFDLVLFGMVRESSLKSIGVIEPELLTNYGLMLDNWQMGGMLLGGIFWGILGDKRGRLTVLFGSIITYSIANIGNGLVESVQWYAFFRFIAGFGLAGELGAGITLVNEVMVKEKRGIATAFVAATGIFGAVVGGFLVGGIEFISESLEITQFESWRIAYFVGGAMGIVLLILRISVVESSIYNAVKHEKSSLGNIGILFKNKELRLRYFSIIIIGFPIWYLVQLYAKYSPELVSAVGLKLTNPEATARHAIMVIYLGLTVGDLASGLISNYLQSRKKALQLFLLLVLTGLVLFWTVGIHSEFMFFLSIGIIGFAAGYWAIFMSTAAESFGTNIRSTVTNTAPNFVRGSVILINGMFFLLGSYFGLGTVFANILIGVIIMGLAFWALRNLKETFHTDLDYMEE